MDRWVNAYHTGKILDRSFADKGLPQYRDEQESDLFLLSGVEDLVPVFKKDADGNWIRGPADYPSYDQIERDSFLARRYRPRSEGLFAWIERWTGKSDGNKRAIGVPRRSLSG